MADVNIVARMAVAGVVALVCTAAWARAARRLGLVDHPGPRKLQRAPVPLAGGIGFATGITVAFHGVHGYGAILWATWALVVLGIADDAFDLRARIRLVGQAVAALPAVAVLAPNVGFPRALEVAVALVCVLGVICTFKCIDCADGVASAVAIPAAFALAGLGSWSAGVTAMAAAVAGAAVGFLVLNMPPARCYLGEGGSTAMGGALALVALAAASSVAPDGALRVGLASMIVLAVPVADFVLVHARRYRAGVRRVRDLMASAGTDHLPHRLRARGRGPWGVAALCGGATAACGGAALISLSGGFSGVFIGACAVVAVMSGAEYLLRRGNSPRSRPTPLLAATTGTRR